MSDSNQNNSETSTDNNTTAAEGTPPAAGPEETVEVEVPGCATSNHNEEETQREEEQSSSDQEQKQPEGQEPKPEMESTSDENQDHQKGDNESEEKQQVNETETADQLVQVAEGVVKEILEAADEAAQHLTETLVNEESVETSGERKESLKMSQTGKVDQHTSTVGTSPIKDANETQEVSSTTKDHPPRGARSGRRPSYTSGRGYASGGYQNYGLAYLPYKSNFEPSEDARRKADEFFKTLKLQ